ncbi:MAG: ornithine decarboxylase [Candidatus Atribacteria bacterium]|nr:ornithine decarboxylase [Candidatus Atribacteria bacterium]
MSQVMKRNLLLTEEEIIDLVKRYDTPLLVVVREKLLDNFNAFSRFLPGVGIFYAVKANPHPEIIKVLHQAGASFDVASHYEIELAYQEGVPPRKMVFANTIKRKRGLRRAKELGVKLMTYDNREELKKIARVFPEAELVLRLKTAPTGSRSNLSYKFGASPEEALDLLKEARRAGLRPVGLSFHVGSPCHTISNYLSSLEMVREILEKAQKEGINLNLIDIGGGFPLQIYAFPDEPLSLETIGKELSPLLREFSESGYRIIAEPGRCLVGSACILLTKVIGKARRSDRVWYYLDDGVYGTFSAILFDKSDFEYFTLKDTSSYREPAVLAGPTCDSIDVITQDILLPSLELDDLIVVPDIGAYSWASATNFNGFEKPKVVLV